MRHYADTPSQQARQFAANAALDAADAAARRDASLTHIRVAHQARQNRRAERQALEERGNFAAVKTGTDYERFVASVLAAAGHTVHRIGGGGDYGADLIVSVHGENDTVIQCKFYTHPVGYDAVQQAYTAKALYKATAAYVVTNTAYTPQARRAARRLGVTLTNHAEIVALL